MPRMKLGVNIDHVATLRQARGGRDPEPAKAARICQRAGAHSIVMHLREDRRHVQDADLARVRRAVSIRLNLEMSLAPDIVRVALDLAPDQITLVPERRQERTTESGLDVIGQSRRIARLLGPFRRRKTLVSLFIDPDPRQLAQAARLGADAVEFHTGEYAAAGTPAARRREWLRLERAAVEARRLGITAHAGHGLDYDNVRQLCRIPGLDELNIGYSIVTRALWVGLERAVRQMRALIP